MFKVSVDTRGIDQFLSNSQNLINSIPVIKDKVGYALTMYARKVAKTYVGSGGPIVNTGTYAINGWAPIKESTMNTRQKNMNFGEILKDTGELKSSISVTYSSSSTSSYGVLYSDDDKAGYHEQGYTAGGSPRFKGKAVPARPFLTPAAEFVMNDPSFNLEIENFINTSVEFLLFAKKSYVASFVISKAIRVAGRASIRTYEYSKKQKKTLSGKGRKKIK